MIAELLFRGHRVVASLFSGSTGQPMGGGTLLGPDLMGRIRRGILPLIGYGVLGTIVEAHVAPFVGQIGLVGGFTLETPFSIPERGYRRRSPAVLDFPAFLAGQRVAPGIPIRSHTTGLMDAGVRLGWLGAWDADELVHPGRTATFE